MQKIAYLDEISLGFDWKIFAGSGSVSISCYSGALTCSKIYWLDN